MAYTKNSVTIKIRSGKVWTKSGLAESDLKYFKGLEITGKHINKHIISKGIT
jgi:hypothetical protein